METVDFLIVGAGIAGLMCATELRAAGKSVKILDKGRGYGGRMATRRIGDARIDHGAQYFTVRDERFRAYVDKWLEAGIICEWFSHLEGEESHSSEGHPRYCGRTGMTDVPKFLGKSLDVFRSELVIELYRDMEGWVARSQSGNTFRGRRLVLSAPLPQSLALLDTTGLNYAGDDLSELKKVHYEKGLAALVILDGPSGLPHPGCLKTESDVLTWIGDNQAKGISPKVPAVTLHASADFAAVHWESPDDVRAPLMLEAAEPFLLSRVIEVKCHRWGFTTAVNPWPERFYFNSALGFILGGDAFGGPRVEGAALSGIEMAQRLLC